MATLSGNIRQVFVDPTHIEIDEHEPFTGWLEASTKEGIRRIYIKDDKWVYGFRGEKNSPISPHFRNQQPQEKTTERMKEPEKYTLKSIKQHIKEQRTSELDLTQVISVLIDHIECLTTEVISIKMSEKRNEQNE